LIQSLDHPSEFLYRDEYAKQYGINDVQPPAILIQNANELNLWIGAESLDICGSLSELKGLVTTWLEECSYMR